MSLISTIACARLGARSLSYRSKFIMEQVTDFEGPIVIDSPMGTGKTTWMINYILRMPYPTLSANKPYKWLYITPLLSEVERIQEACAAIDMIEPVALMAHDSKLDHLRELVTHGRNIVSTHALFRYVTPEIIELLRDRGYHLVIDETFGMVEDYDGLTRKNRKLLEDHGIISVDADGMVHWHQENARQYIGNERSDRFRDLKNLCQNGSLVCIKDSFFLWRMPAHFLNAFNNVFILTYLFRGSLMSYYLEAHDMSYGHFTLKDGDTADYHELDTSSIKPKYRRLISLYEGPLNKCGNRYHKAQPLSSSWFERECRKGASEKVKAIQKATYNFFFNVAQTKSDENMWTSKKSISKHLGGRGYQKGFVSSNMRATNEYRHKVSCAYLVNKFIKRPLSSYFNEYGISPREDLYALTELIQWIWRAQIRDGKPINVYIPSERMRTIFKNWLEYDDVEITDGKILYG